MRGALALLRNAEKFHFDLVRTDRVDPATRVKKRPS